MSSEGLGEMLEGDSADICAGKFPLVSMGGRAEGLACADPGARTPIGASRIINISEKYGSGAKCTYHFFFGIKSNFSILNQEL